MFSSQRLIDAVEEGDLAAVRRLVAQGADVNTRGLFKITPLMEAAKDDREDIARFLLEHPGTDVNALNAGGTSALMVAARRGNLQMVKILLSDTRTDANLLGKFGGTALMNAAGFGHIEVVRELLKIDNISLAATYTDKKHSPLSIAQQNGHLEVVRLLEDFISCQSRKPSAPKGPGV